MEVLGSGDTQAPVISQDETKIRSSPVLGVPPLHPAKAEMQLDKIFRETEESTDETNTGRKAGEERCIDSGVKFKETKLLRSESLPELTTKLHNEAMKLKKLKTSSDNRLRQTETELDDARNTIDEQTETIRQLQLMNRNLRAKIEEMQEAQEDSYRYRTESCDSCATMKTEFFNLDERLAECIRERDALKDTDKIRRENFEELLEKYRLMNIENEELKIQALKEQEECQRLISEYHARQESINTLTQQLCVSDEINKEKDEEILQLSRKLSESLRKNMELDDEYGVLHNILKETEEVVKSQQEQLNYCHKALQRSHSEISKLNTTKSQLLKQCEEYQDKDQDMQCALKALNENISELANERRHLCNEITNLNDHVREKKLKIAEIKKDLKRQKKLIKKVSGVANQQPQSGDEECQPSLDYIFDDMDELDFHHAAPVSSSPRRGKKQAVCIQEDEDVSDEEMLSCRYPERLSPSPIFVGSSTWKRKSIWNTGQSGTEVKPQSGSHSKYVQTTDDKYQEFECNQKNQRKYQHNASEFTTLTSKAVSENKPGAKTGNKIMKLKNQVPESRLLSYKQGTGKENVRPDQDTEENYKDSMHQNSSEDVLPGVRRRSRARRLTYMNSQIIPDLHQRASEVQIDDHTQSHWHGLDCPEIENNRFSKFCHHFQEERKDMQQDSVNDGASEFSYDRKELPALDDISDEINRRGSSSSSIAVTDEESIRYSSSNSDDNQTSGSEKTEGDYTEKNRTDSKQRPHPSEIDAEGVLLRKHEMESYIIRSKNRAWQSVYVVQEGKILKFYEDQYSKNMGLISEDKPPLELTHAQVTVATDYTKKKHVFRIRLTTGAQYLFQARDVPEMMFWLCSLDAVTHGPNETTAPYGANYPLHIMENSVDSSRKPTVWKKLLQNAYSPLKKH